jgi:hypothetical protein
VPCIVPGVLKRVPSMRSSLDTWKRSSRGSASETAVLDTAYICPTTFSSMRNVSQVNLRAAHQVHAVILTVGCRRCDLAPASLEQEYVVAAKRYSPMASVECEGLGTYPDYPPFSAGRNQHGKVQLILGCHCPQVSGGTQRTFGGMEKFLGERRELSGEWRNFWGNAENFWGNAEISGAMQKS